MSTPAYLGSPDDEAWASAKRAVLNMWPPHDWEDSDLDHETRAVIAAAYAVLIDRTAREERIRREAAEDERDRLFAICDERQDDTSDDDRWREAVEAGCFLDDQGAMLPADRVVLRASRSEPDCPEKDDT